MISIKVNKILKKLLNGIPEHAPINYKNVSTQDTVNIYKRYYDIIFKLLPLKYKSISRIHNIPLNELLRNYLSYNLSYFDNFEQQKTSVPKFNTVDEYYTNQINDSINISTVETNFTIHILFLKFYIVNYIKKLLLKITDKSSQFLYLKYTSNMDKYYPELRNENIEKFALLFLNSAVYYTIMGYDYILFDAIIYFTTSIITRTILLCGIDPKPNIIYNFVINMISSIFAVYISSNKYSLDIIDYTKNIFKTKSKVIVI